MVSCGVHLVPEVASLPGGGVQLLATSPLVEPRFKVVNSHKSHLAQTQQTHARSKRNLYLSWPLKSQTKVLLSR